MSRQEIIEDFNIEQFITDAVNGNLDEDATRQLYCQEFVNVCGMLIQLARMEQNPFIAKQLFEIQEVLKKWVKFWFVTRPLLLGEQVKNK